MSEEMNGRPKIADELLRARKLAGLAWTVAGIFFVLLVITNVLDGLTAKQYEENAELQEKIYDAKLESQALEYEGKILELEKRIETLEDSGDNLLDGKASEEDKAKFREDLKTLGEELRAARDWGVEKAKAAGEVAQEELAEQLEEHPDVVNIPIVGRLLERLSGDSGSDSQGG